MPPNLEGGYADTLRAIEHAIERIEEALAAEIAHGRELYEARHEKR